MTFVLSTLPGQTQWSSGSSNRDTIGWSLGRELRSPRGTAEGSPFSRSDLERLIDLASRGIRRLVKAQREALKGLELP